jgi:alkanesulfonate monooxygenase SsuD/methylene tetrahydromethanopterin reductase-like flavin-dependent oxidoreductase (luciferase family)
MEFGLLLLGDNLANPVTGEQRTRAERHRQIIEVAVRASRLGIDVISLGEHRFSYRGDGQEYVLSAPHVVLAAIAERTERTLLGTGVTLLPNHDPVLLVQDFATLDLISGGRAELIVGNGIYADVFRQMGQDPKRSREMAAENLGLLLKLWNETGVSWEGEFRPPLDNVTIEPRPLQPNAPVWVGGGRSEVSLRLAAKHGVPIQFPGVLRPGTFFKDLAIRYRELWVEAGHAPENCRIAHCSHLFVRNDGAQARKEFEPYHVGYLQWVFQTIHERGDFVLDPNAKAPDRYQAYEDPVNSPSLCGTPEEAVDRILEWNELLGGIDRYSFVIDAGGQSDEMINGTLDILVEEVIPAIRSGLN